MDTTRIVFCSDVHFCHKSWYGKTSEKRLEKLVEDLNNLYKRNPYKKAVFLGDYSLDFWAWEIFGSWISEGVSNTDNFVKEYASRLKVPYYMLPGNHEQYSNEDWLRITGFNRKGCFEQGGYLFIACDNFAGLLNPKTHSDGIYTPTDLKYIKQKMEEYPDLPVVLCAHFFDTAKEPKEFFDFIKNEKRITILICGHDHILQAENLGERADNVYLYHDGHYSYAGNDKTPYDVMWGFCEMVLSAKGINIHYLEPHSTFEFDGKIIEHESSIKEELFVKRRDIKE